MEMLCPGCRSEGQVSNLFVGSVSTTDMYYLSFYDEQGNKHTHDNNTRSFSWHCSKGHGGFGEDTNDCWCGWVGNRGLLLLDTSSEAERDVLVIDAHCQIGTNAILAPPLHIVGGPGPAQNLQGGDELHE